MAADQVTGDIPVHNSDRDRETLPKTLENQF